MAPPVRTVSVKAFGVLYDVTPERVYQLIQEGLPHRKRARSTQIVPAEAIRWLQERAVAKAAKPAVPIEALRRSDEQARKIRAEADLKELELAERRGELVAVEAHTEVVETFLGGLAAVSSGQLSRFEREIIRVTTPAEARQLTRKIHAAMMEAARTHADKLEAEADTIEAEDDASAGAAGVA